MTAAGWVALTFAIFGAFSYGAGSILQAVGAKRSSGTVRTLAHPLYLIGVGCDVLAWAGSMIALRELPVYQVQSVLAGSLAVTVVAARMFLASRLRGRDVFAVVVTIGALTVLAMSAGPQEHVSATSGIRIGFCAAALATALIGWAATKIGSPGIVAALAGLAMGGAALSGRALALPEQPMADLGASALAIVTEPLTAAVLTFSAAGMLLYTQALQHGDVGPVTAVLWISEVVAPSAVALAVLGDTVRAGWDLWAAIAGLVTVGAAVLLATAPATSETANAADGRSYEPAGPVMLGAAHRPAALPSSALPVGTIVWWGAPPIWRPPNRSIAATAAQARPAEPATAGATGSPATRSSSARRHPPVVLQEDRRQAAATYRETGANPWWESRE
jgi:hypothetical protein